MCARILTFSMLCAALGWGQQAPDLAAQKEAMQKLAFLVGKWSGDAVTQRGPNQSIKVRQTEEVQFKLDGLVLLIEGTGRDPDSGEAKFHALATISYDDAGKAYHFRAYNDGRYLDVDLKVPEKGFEWSYKMGPLDVKFAMNLNEKGEWVEIGETRFRDGPAQRSFEMTLRKPNR